MAKRTVVKDGYRYTYEGDRLVRVDKVETPKVQSQKDADRSARARKNYSGNQTAKVETPKVQSQKDADRSARARKNYSGNQTAKVSQSTNIKHQEANTRRSDKKVTEYFPNAKKKTKPLTQMTDEEYNMRRSLREFEAYMANKEEYEFATKKRTKTGDELDWIMSDTYKKERGEKFDIDNYHNDFVELLKDYDEIGSKFGNEYIDPKEMAEFTKKVNAFYTRTDLMKEYMDIYGVDYSPTLQEMYSAISGEMDVIKYVTDNANKSNSQYNSAEEFGISKITDYEGLRNKRDYYEELAKAASGDQKIHYEGLVDYINGKIASPELVSTMTPDQIQSEREQRLAQRNSILDTAGEMLPGPGSNLSYTSEGYFYYDPVKGENASRQYEKNIDSAKAIANSATENYDNYISMFNDAVAESEALRLVNEYMNNSDYSTFNQPNVSSNGPIYVNDANEDNLIYRAVNGEAEAIAGTRSAQAILSGTQHTFDYSVIGTMDENEIGTYNYIVNTRGLEAGTEFIKKLAPVLNKRRTQDVMESAYKFSNEHPVLALISNVASSPLTAVTDFAQGVSDFAGGIKGDVDVYDEAHRGANIRTAMSQGGREAFDSPTAQFIYSTIETGGKEAMLYAATLGIGKAFNLGAKGLSAVNMLAHSGSAFEGKLIQYKNEGYSDASAITAGLVSASIEAITEALPMERLIKQPDLIKNINVSKVAQVLKKAGVSGLEEGLEEGISMIATDIYDVATNHEKLTAYYQAYNKAIEEGKSEKEATTQGFLSALGELGQNVVAGAFVGLGMGGANAYANVTRADNVKKEARLYFEDFGTSAESIGTLISKMQGSADTNTVKLAQNISKYSDGGSIDSEVQDEINNNPVLRGITVALAEAKRAESIKNPTTEDASESAISEPETEVADESVSSKVYSMLTGGKLTANQIDSIVDDSESRREFQELTGIEIKGTKAEQRAIVRDFQKDARNIEDLKLKNAGHDTIALTTAHEKVNSLLEKTNSENMGKIIKSEALSKAYEELTGTALEGTMAEKKAIIREGAKFAREVYAESAKSNRGTVRQSMYRDVDETSAETVSGTEKEGNVAGGKVDTKQTITDAKERVSALESAVSMASDSDLPQARAQVGRSASKIYSRHISRDSEFVKKLTSIGGDEGAALDTAEGIFYFMYNAGKQGTNMSVAVNAMHTVFNSSEFPELDTYTTAFYYAGVNDRTSMTGKKGARIVENDTLKSMRASNLLDERQENAINALANNLGIDVEFVEDLGEGNNGSFNVKTGQLKISRRSEIPFVEAVLHESIHGIRSISPESYNNMADLVFEILSVDSEALSSAWKYTASVYRDQLIDKEGNLNRELVNEELVANVMSKLLFNEEYVNELAGIDTSLVQRVWNAIKDFFDRVFKRYKRTPFISLEMEDAMKLLHKEYDKLERIYKDALGATRNVRTKDVTVSDDSGVMYAITRDDVQLIQGIGRKSINDLTESELKQLESVAQKYYREMGVKSPFFRRWFGDWRANEKKRIKFVSVNSDAINTEDIPNGKFKNNDTNWEIKSNPDGKGETAHKRGKWSDDYHALKDIKAMLSNAILLDTVIASNPSKRMGKNAILVHHLYCPIKTNNKNEFGIAKLYVSEYYDGGKKFYLNKIEKMSSDTRGYVEKNNNAPRSKNSASNDTTISVAEIFDFVKKNDVNYESDSEHPVYFNPKPTSLVLNEDGTPKVMYRGGSEDIRIFDRKKSRASNLYGRGFYFTESEAHAKQYGDAREYYLNIKTPLKPHEHNISKEQVRKFLEAIAENEDDYDIWNYGTTDIDEILNTVYGKGDFEVLQDINATAIGDLVEAVELFNKVNNTSYDGIVLPTETVAFYPNQIKSVDNGGTFSSWNDDIMLSKSGLTSGKNNGKINKNSEQFRVMWTIEEDIMDKRDVANFYTQIANFRKRGHKNYHVSQDGEYIFAINNKLVYTDGDYMYPEITKVISFKSDNQTLLNYGRSLICNYEKYGIEIGQAIEIAEITFGEGNVTQSKIENSRAFQREISGRTGKNIGTSDSRSGEDVELYSKSPNRTTNLNNITPDYARTSTDPSFEVFKEVVLEKLNEELEKAKAELGELESGRAKVTKPKTAAEVIENSTYIGDDGQKVTIVPEGTPGAKKVYVSSDYESAGNPTERVRTGDPAKSRVPLTALRSNVLNNEHTKSVIDLLKNDDSFGTYFKFTDDAALGEAERRYEEKGYKGMLESWKSTMESGALPTKQTSTDGMFLLKKASEHDDGEAVIYILSELQPLITNSAQIVQSVNILARKLSGESRAYMAVKSLKKLESRIRQKKGNEGVTLEFPKELVNEYIKAVNYELGMSDTSVNENRNSADSDVLQSKSGKSELKTFERKTKKLEKRIEEAHNKKVKFNISDSLKNEYVSSVDMENDTGSSSPYRSSDEILADMWSAVAEQLPTSWSETFNLWRYASMLMSPATHLSNALSNYAHYTNTLSKNMYASLIESVAIRDKNKRTKSVGASIKSFLPGGIRKKVDKLYNFAIDDAKKIKNDLKGDNKYDVDKTSRSKLKSVEKIGEGIFGALKWEDWVMMRGHYARALSSFMQARGYKPSTITETQLDEGRKIAIEEARRATFNEANAFSQMLNEASRKNKVVDFVIGSEIPFAKVPANVLRTGVDYSPLGFVRTIGNILNKDIDANTKIDMLARNLTGTQTFVLGAMLFAAGILSVSGDDEETEEKLYGAQKYSIKFGDKSWSLDWMAPAGIALFAGAQFWHDVTAEGEKFEVIDLIKAVPAIGESTMNILFEMTMLENLAYTLKSMQYGDSWGEKAADFISSAVFGYLGQFIPTPVGQIAKSIDNTKRGTYIDKNSKIPSYVQVGIQQLVRKIPFLYSKLEPTINEHGEPEKNSVDNVVLRTIDNLILPGSLKKLRSNAIDDELMRLYKEDPDGKDALPKKLDKSITVNGEKKDLTAKEYTKLQTTFGQTYYSKLKEIIGTDYYNNLSDENKVKLLKKVKEYATEKAKGETDSRFRPDSWLKIAMETPGVYQYVIDTDPKESFGVDDLTDAQDKSFRIDRSDIVNNILAQYKPDDSDYDFADKFYDYLNSYSKEVALEKNSDGQYEVDTKWMIAAKDMNSRKQAEFIYAKALTSGMKDDEANEALENDSFISAEVKAHLQDFGTHFSKTPSSVYESGGKGEENLSKYNISMDVFVDVFNTYDKLEDYKDSNGKTVSKQKQICDYIGKLNISDAQKSALYRVWYQDKNAKGKSTIKDVTWNYVWK